MDFLGETLCAELAHCISKMVVISMCFLDNTGQIQKSVKVTQPKCLFRLDITNVFEIYRRKWQWWAIVSTPGARCGNGYTENGNISPTERYLVIETPLMLHCRVVELLDVADETSVFL